MRLQNTKLIYSLPMGRHAVASFTYSPIRTKPLVETNNYFSKSHIVACRSFNQRNKSK
ncbi:hypothetical protein [Bernardetia sp.]|uniref:hypothetical protein n=1 Tax=Bernardetia sp. TaxID=1937974 RepID=UPI0025BCBCF6|nr:hypothetical protein [Bernardetia sp.]